MSVYVYSETQNLRLLEGPAYRKINRNQLIPTSWVSQQCRNCLINFFFLIWHRQQQQQKMMKSQRMEIKEEDETELKMLHPRGASSQLFPFPLHDYLNKE